MSKITIGIPTFQREELLIQVLASAKSDGILGAFPLIVLDDGPSPTLKHSISTQFPTVNFQRHQKNMGMSRSILDLFQACSTEYCMMSADDDFLSMSGLEKANAYVSESSPDFVSTQCLSGNQIMRGRVKEGPIRYSEIGPAAYHAPGLIYKVDTALRYAKLLEKLLEMENYVAIMCPQVILAYLILFHGGTLQWHPSAPVVEGFIAPSQLKDLEGDGYNELGGRIREYEGWIQFFQACDEWLPSANGRELASHVGKLKMQELYVQINTSLNTKSLAAGLSFRGAALFYNLRRPSRALAELFEWTVDRKAAHKNAARLQSSLLHLTK